MDAAGRVRHALPDVSDTPSRPTRATDTPETRISRAWWIFATSFFILGLIALLRIGTRAGAAGRLGGRRTRLRRRVRRHPASPGGHRARGGPARRGRIVRAHPVRPVAVRVAGRDRGRHRGGAGDRDRAPTISSSPDAGPDARVLEATLVSARPGVPDSTTRLPIADLDDPVDGRVPGEREPVAIPITAGDPGSGRGRLPARPVRRRHRPSGGRRAGQRVPASTDADAADPGLPPGDRRPDRRRGPRGLRPEQHAGRAADAPRPASSARSSSRRRTAEPWPATTRRLLLAGRPPRRPPRWRGPTRTGRPRPERLHRRPDRPAEPALLRRVLRPARPPPPGRRRGRRADDRHRPLQGAQRQVRPRDGRPGAARGRRRDRRGRPRRRRPGPLRRRGVRVLLRNPTSAVALEVGERVRAAVGALDLRRLGVPAVTRLGRGRGRGPAPTSRSATSSTRPTGRSTAPSAPGATGSSPRTGRYGPYHRAWPPTGREP